MPPLLVSSASRRAGCAWIAPAEKTLRKKCCRFFCFGGFPPCALAFGCHLLGFFGDFLGCLSALMVSREPLQSHHSQDSLCSKPHTRHTKDYVADLCLLGAHSQWPQKFGAQDYLSRLGQQSGCRAGQCHAPLPLSCDGATGGGGWSWLAYFIDKICTTHPPLSRHLMCYSAAPTERGTTGLKCKCGMMLLWPTWQCWKKRLMCVAQVMLETPLPVFKLAGLSGPCMLSRVQHRASHMLIRWTWWTRWTCLPHHAPSRRDLPTSRCRSVEAQAVQAADGCTWRAAVRIEQSQASAAIGIISAMSSTSSSTSLHATQVALHLHIYKRVHKHHLSVEKFLSRGVSEPRNP